MASACSGLENNFTSPARDRSQGMAVRMQNPSHYNIRGQWSVTRLWSISCVEKSFHRKMESSEKSKVFIRGKVSM